MIKVNCITWDELPDAAHTPLIEQKFPCSIHKFLNMLRFPSRSLSQTSLFEPSAAKIGIDFESGPWVQTNYSKASPSLGPWHSGELQGFGL